MTSSAATPVSISAPAHRRWRPSSLALITLPWLILYLGGIFSPGLLDDVDSVYIEIAREMLLRHDFVTPYIDGIRFFDKPPLMYWLAAGSMHIFGVHDWAARLPLALGVLALLFAVYALGIRLFAAISPAHAPDRAGLYAALAMALSIGPWLYTRFYIPDILIALWMTLAVHLFLIALERANARVHTSTNTESSRPDRSNRHPERSEGPLYFETHDPPESDGAPSVGRMAQRGVTTAPSPLLPGAPFTSGLIAHEWGRMTSPSPLLPMLGFAAVVALSVLTKGLIGLIFPILFAILYLALTGQLALLRHLSLIPATITFLAIALPWHILAALRNPAIAMPSGVGLPPRAGWAWFYLYNEHIARFLGRRIPHDYGQVPIPLFWLLLILWLFPWAAFLPSALIAAVKQLRVRIPTNPGAPACPERTRTGLNETWVRNCSIISARLTEACLALLLWAGIILGFFTLSSRQEYYHLPALPALALLVGALLAAADHAGCPALDRQSPSPASVLAGAESRAGWGPVQLDNPAPAATPFTSNSQRRALRGSLYGLVPIGTLLFLICGYFALFAPAPRPGATLNDLLSSNPALYNLSLGHVFDLTGSAMGLFRWPLVIVALSAVVLGPIQHFIRRSAHLIRGSAAGNNSAAGKNSTAAHASNRTFAANLLIAAAATGMLLAAHSGYVRFNPILGSKDIALAINAQFHPGDLILIDGELTSGSSLLFYTRQPALLVNGRVNGPWFGSFWPGSSAPDGLPSIFLTDRDLTRLWSGPHRIFLLTYHPTARTRSLAAHAPVHDLTDSGGKTLLCNRE